MRSSFLLLALFGMAAAQAPAPQWQKMPAAGPGEVFPGISNTLPPHGHVRLRMPAKNPQQWSIILEDGQIFSTQTLLTKMDAQAIINDVERYLELLAFAHEYNEWGINGPPTGFSITRSRTPFVVPVVKRKKRSLQKPINNDDMVKMFMAVAKKFEKVQKTKREVADNGVQQKQAKDLVEMMSAIKDGMDGKATEVDVPSSMADYFKIVWKSFLNMKNAGFGESMKNLATSLTGDVKKATEVKPAPEESVEAKKVVEEPKKKETKDEFAALVFNKDSKRKASALGSQKLKKFGKQMELAKKAGYSPDLPESFEKVYREGSFGGRDRGHPDPLVVARKRNVPSVADPEIPSLTLTGKYHLVPKAWTHEEMENFYNAMVEDKRKKRALRANRVEA